jgi:hypothetical protein
MYDDSSTEAFRLEPVARLPTLAQWQQATARCPRDGNPALQEVDRALYRYENSPFPSAYEQAAAQYNALVDNLHQYRPDTPSSGPSSPPLLTPDGSGPMSYLYQPLPNPAGTRPPSFPSTPSSPGSPSPFAFAPPSPVPPGPTPSEILRPYHPNLSALAERTMNDVNGVARALEEWGRVEPRPPAAARILGDTVTAGMRALANNMIIATPGLAQDFPIPQQRQDSTRGYMGSYGSGSASLGSASPGPAQRRRAPHTR